MKLLIVLSAFFVSSALSLNPGLRAMFNIGLRPGIDFMYNIPRTVLDAKSEKWTQLERPNSPLPSLVMYCARERVICALYHPDTGVVSGLQVAIPLSDFTGAVFDWKTQGFMEWTPTPADGEETVTYQTKQLYFTSEESLQRQNKVESVARRTDVLTEKAVWVSGFYGELVKISSRKSDIEKSVFTKQACIPWMGRHYYYNMSSTTECTADKIFNWFPLVNNNVMIGMGFLAPGKLEIKKGNRSWFEHPGKSDVQAIVPSGPKCLYELAGNPTFTTMHIYFVDNPWLITCLFQ